MLPFCFIALLPGVFYIFLIGRYVLALVDILTVTSLLVVAFMPGIRLAVRKIMFVSCIYAFSCAQLYYIGLSGPGLVYLLAASILSILIFPGAYSFWPAWANAFICVLFALAASFNAVPWPHNLSKPAGEWVAVSSNLVFVSFLLSALIPRLFNGLQETIDKEKQLKEALNIKQQSLQQTLNLLEQKNNELEQFAYVASHDLQEPLRMVTSFLSQLEKKFADIIDDKGKKYIYFAVDGAKRMRQIILDLLEFSRAGRTENILENVDVNELVNEIRVLFRKQVEEKKAVIQAGGLPVIRAYKVPVRQVFQNLVSNALKYGKKGIDTEITITFNELKLHWQFAVTDNGIGIAEEYFDKIFVIFQRLHNSDEYNGTGMGLAITKKVIESQGGKIWVESEEGKGSTFYFTLLKQQ
jgi:signal transduction histidine kinase